MRALTALDPDAVLIEGPPDADGIIAAAADAAMQPPVAILVYAPETPRAAAFFPFATFSPEWQALRFALARSLPVRFMDLGQTHRLHAAAPEDEPVREMRSDPLAAIAAVAGYSDGERWWDRMVEHRHDDADAFAALGDLMAGVREQQTIAESDEDRLREAAMRQIVRATAADHERVAVVCGAWHVPALRELPPARADAQLLKGLPRTKVAATWVPWTFGRLTTASGYGAGIASPGWYDHLWNTSDGIIDSWMTKAARALRTAGLDVSPAHAIEATRLAGALASLRDVPLPGFPEAGDAMRAVFAFGDPLPMALVHEELIVAERLGAVPADVPQVPLALDIAREQKRLRLPPAAQARELELDLRTPGDRDRSTLLHRLALLDIPWGIAQRVRGATGTFREAWTLRWRPEFSLNVIEGSIYGTTLALAAEARTRERAERATELATLTGLLDAALAAALGDSVRFILARIDELAALTHDVARMLEALPAFAEVRRYGDVRGTDLGAIGATIDALVARACVGLPTAVLALDDAAAEQMLPRIDGADAALRVLDSHEHRTAWLAALARIARDDRVHGLVAGRALRLGFDAGSIDVADVRQAISRALSHAAAPPNAAAWIDGLLRGSGVLLVHHPELIDVVDAWLTALDADAFIETLPLVRRTFATFAPAERRAMGERIAGTTGTSRANVSDDVDESRARLVLPVLTAILGEAPS